MRPRLGFVRAAVSILLQTHFSRARTVSPNTTRPPPLTAAPNKTGGKWQQRTSYPELDMSNADTLADFLQSGLAAFPPSTDRKYMMVFWNHGSGWAGYGLDHTCSPIKTYSDRACGMMSVGALATGGFWELGRRKPE